MGVTSDHRIQIDSKGNCMAAGKLYQMFKEGQNPKVYDGSSVHTVEEVEFKKERRAVVEVHFEGDGVAYVWLRPRRWRTKSCESDCPRLTVRGEHPFLIAPGLPGSASGPEDQARRYGIHLRGPFIDDFEDNVLFRIKYSSDWASEMQAQLRDRNILSEARLRVVDTDSKHLCLKFDGGIPHLDPRPDTQSFPLNVIQVPLPRAYSLPPRS